MRSPRTTLSRRNGGRIPNDTAPETSSELSQYRTVRVTCHAQNPDPKRRGALCGAVLGDVPGPVRFVGTSARRSHSVDGRIRLQCGRRDCRTWNIFEAILPEPSAE